MQGVDSISQLKDLLSTNEISLKKSLGQNLLWKREILEEIVSKASIKKEDTVVEIGPGLGFLSSAILNQSPARLIAIEKDESFRPALQKIQQEHSNFEVLYSDALLIPISELATKRVQIVSNLPYNVSVKLLLNWSKEVSSIESMILTVQAEVADRICAKQGTKSYGKLSLAAQLHFDCISLLELSPEAFFPKPKVRSKVVRMKARQAPEELLVKMVERIATFAFSQRRKKLSNSLSMLLSESKLNLKTIGIDPNKRAEDLSVQEYVQMAKHLLA